MAGELVNLQKAVADLDTDVEQAITMLDDISARLTALIGAGTINPADLQQLADTLNAERAKLEARMAADQVPAAPSS